MGSSGRLTVRNAPTLIVLGIFARAFGVTSGSSSSTYGSRR